MQNAECRMMNDERKSQIQSKNSHVQESPRRGLPFKAHRTHGTHGKHEKNHCIGFI